MCLRGERGKYKSGKMSKERLTVLCVNTIGEFENLLKISKATKLWLLIDMNINLLDIELYLNKYHSSQHV